LISDRHHRLRRHRQCRAHLHPHCHHGAMASEPSTSTVTTSPLQWADVPINPGIDGTPWEVRRVKGHSQCRTRRWRRAGSRTAGEIDATCRRRTGPEHICAANRTDFAGSPNIRRSAFRASPTSRATSLPASGFSFGHTSTATTPTTTALRSSDTRAAWALRASCRSG
jgi:hypothetical protein